MIKNNETEGRTWTKIQKCQNDSHKAAFISTPTSMWSHSDISSESVGVNRPVHSEMPNTFKALFNETCGLFHPGLQLGLN